MGQKWDFLEGLNPITFDIKLPMFKKNNILTTVKHVDGRMVVWGFYAALDLW